MATYQGATYNGDQYAGEPLTSQVQVPPAPFGLTSVRYTQPILLISWTGSANTVTFEIQRSPDGVTWSSLSSSIVPSSYLDTTTTWGTTYYYRVQATNAAGASPWSATLTVVNPNGDDGDWLYLNADVIPTLAEADGDWLYLNADVIPTLVESGGDWLYLNANLLPSTTGVGFIVGAPGGTLYQYGTNPPVGFLVLAPPGQLLQILPGPPSDMAIGGPPGNPLQVITLAPGDFVIGVPVGILRGPPSLPLTVYENVGFPTPLDSRGVLYVYENVGYARGTRVNAPVNPGKPKLDRVRQSARR